MHLIVSFKVASIKYDSSNRNDNPTFDESCEVIINEMNRNRNCMLSKENRNIQQGEYQLRHRSVLQKDYIETQHQKAINDIINMTYGKVVSKCINQDIENVSINDDSIEEYQ